MDFSALTKHRVVRLVMATVNDWMEDNAMRLSAALAYYSIFSIAPLLIIAVSVAGLVLGDEAVRGYLDDQLSAYVGPLAAKSIQSMIQSASKPAEGWVGASIGFATLLVGASGVFGQLKDALNTIWEVKPIGGTGVWRFIRRHLLDFGIVLVIGFLLLTSLLLSTALTALTDLVGVYIGVPAAVGMLITFLVSFSVVTLLFAFIFKVLPDAQIEWRNVWVGALATALLFELGKFGLSFYLGRESTASSFGAAGSVVLLLLWVYYASCILLLGAEFTQVYARETGHHIRPIGGAIPVTTESRAQQGLVPVAVIEQAREDRPLALAPPTSARVRPDPAAAHPFALLLAVTAGSYVLGLLLRRDAERERTPAARIREGFADLGEETSADLAAWLHRAQDRFARRSR